MVRNIFRWFYQQRSSKIKAALSTSFVPRQWDKRTAMEKLTYDDVFTDVKSAFIEAVSSVKPSKLVKENVLWDGSTFTVKGMYTE